MNSDEVINVFPKSKLSISSLRVWGEDGDSFGESSIGFIFGHLVQVTKLKPVNSFKGGLSGIEKICKRLQHDSALCRNQELLHGIHGLYLQKIASLSTYLIYPLPSVGNLSQLYGITTKLSQNTSQKSSSTTLTPQIKVSIVLDIMEAVQYLHQHKIVHGLLTPNNVLIFANHRVKLINFGVVEFLHSDTRNALLLKEGYRYTPPEVLCQLRFDLLDKSKYSSETLLKWISSPTFDIYSIGSILFLILSGKVAYYNIETNIDVIAHVIDDNEYPHLPSQYSDRTTLSCLESMMMEFMQHDPSIRPISLTNSLEKVENDYVNIYTSKRQQERDKRNIKIHDIQNEIKEFTGKIASHQDYIVNGRRIIKQREDELPMKYNPKDKIEASQAIDKAYEKLKQFEDELQGFQIDLRHANEDQEELQNRQAKLDAILRNGKQGILQSRRQPHGSEHVSQDDLIEAYCLPRDLEYIHSLIVKDFQNNGMRAVTSYSSSLYSAVNFSGHLDKIVVRAQNLKNVGEDMSQFYYHDNSSEKYHFSAPINPNSIQMSSTPDKISPGTFDRIPTATVSRVVDSDDEEYDDSHASPSQPVSTTPTVIAAHKTLGTVDSDDESSVFPTTYRRYTFNQEPNNVIVFPTESLPEIDPSLMTNKQINKILQDLSRQQAADSDDEDAGIDSDEESIEDMNDDNDDLTDISRLSTSSFHVNEKVNIAIDDSKLNQMKNRGSVTSLTTAMTEEDRKFVDKLSNVEDFELDYLTAIRGSRAEAIGMKRLGHRLNDDYFKKMLAKSQSPLHVAAKLGNDIAVSFLIENYEYKPWQADMDGRTPLHHAAIGGHLKIVRYIIENFANHKDWKDQFSPQEMDAKGFTILMYAVIYGHINVLQYLLEFCPVSKMRYSPVCKDNKFGAPILHWACLANQFHIVEYLLEHLQVPIDDKATDGSNCLFWACYGASCDLINMLIERGGEKLLEDQKSSKRIRNPNGFTYLHVATCSGSADRTKLLIETYKQSMIEKNDEGLSPYDVATGRCKNYLDKRKSQGFLTGSVVDKKR